jgi:hypothetical protein
MKIKKRPFECRLLFSLPAGTMVPDKISRIPIVRVKIMNSVKKYLTLSPAAWFVIGFLCTLTLIVSSGANQASSVPAIGTYQIEHADGQQGVYLLDTRTGQIWLRSVMFYYDLGTPQAPNYKSAQIDR